MRQEGLPRLAHTLRRRLALRRWSRVLGSSALPYLGGCALGQVLLAAGPGPAFVRAPLVVAVALVLAWLLATLALVLAGRPSAATALAAYDARAGTEELFLSAYSLAHDDGAGATIHRLRAQRSLAGARARAPSLFPVHLAPRVWLAALAFVGVASLLPAHVGHERRVPPSVAKRPDPDVGADGRAAARRTAPARAAVERLSPRLLGALARHPDTARLAEALRAGEPEAAGRALDDLARRLRSEGLSPGAKTRVERALAHALAEAEPGDRKTVFAARAEDARRALGHGDAARAAAALGPLADRLREAAGRARRAEALGSRARALRADRPRIGVTSARGKKGVVVGERVGVGTAPYEDEPGHVLAPGRQERVRARPARSSAGGATRKGRDPLGMPRPAGNRPVSFDRAPESALPAGAIPDVHRDTVRRYFEALQGRR